MHQKGQDAKRALEEAREVIAKRLNASYDEIIFTSGGTESDNLAIKGVAFANANKGKHIITTKIEHPAVQNSCKFLEKEGFSVTYLGVDKEGFVSIDELKKAIRKDTILVTMIHGNNEIGTVQDIEAIGKVCKEKGVIFHIDAVQSFAKVPVDVKRQPVDLISMSAHKIHGPKGIGALYIRKGTNLVQISHGGGHEFKLRAGTENVPGAVGFAKAVRLMSESDVDKVAKLRDRFIAGVEREIAEVKLNGPRGERRLCNNVNISFANVEGEALGAYLDADGICTSTGSACASHSLEPSHVLLAIGVPKEIANGTLRMTLSRFTTEQEIDYTISALKKYVQKLRKISPLRMVLKNVL
jgi:cysteine desulfurase